MDTSVFIRVEYRDFEWGFRSLVTPIIGDKLILWYALPDEESEDYRIGTVTRRRFDFDVNYPEVILTVSLDIDLPDKHIPDSPEWQSVEFSKRRKVVV